MNEYVSLNTVCELDDINKTDHFVQQQVFKIFPLIRTVVDYLGFWKSCLGVFEIFKFSNMFWVLLGIFCLRLIHVLLVVIEPVWIQFTNLT